MRGSAGREGRTRVRGEGGRGLAILELTPAAVLGAFPDTAGPPGGAQQAVNGGQGTLEGPEPRPDRCGSRAPARTPRASESGVADPLLHPSRAPSRAGRRQAGAQECDRVGCERRESRCDRCGGEGEVFGRGRKSGRRLPTADPGSEPLPLPSLVGSRLPGLSRSRSELARCPPSSPASLFYRQWSPDSVRHAHLSSGKLRLRLPRSDRSDVARAGTSSATFPGRTSTFFFLLSRLSG